jgi:hypothetical protein
MHPDALAYAFVGERERCAVHACWLLEQWASDAETRATSALDEPTKAPSPLHDTACYRVRVGVLAEVLRASGGAWEHGDIADLIVASASDWTHAPSPIGARYRYDWTADARHDDKHRGIVVAWIRKQLGTPASSRARRLSQR